jgi:hypothetical protein
MKAVWFASAIALLLSGCDQEPINVDTLRSLKEHKDKEQCFIVTRPDDLRGEEFCIHYGT